MAIAAALVELHRGWVSVATGDLTWASKHLRSAKRYLIAGARKPNADCGRLFAVWLMTDPLADAIRQGRGVPDQLTGGDQ